MDEKEPSSDWKARQQVFEGILKSMGDPSPQLLQQLHVDLPRYLADVNPNCQRTALSICELYFASASSINFSQIAHVLIDKCFTTNRAGNGEVATTLLLRCIRSAHDSVLTKIYDELNSKSPKVVRAMISILVAHLQASGAADATTITEHLSSLRDHRDQAIRREATAAIAVASGPLPTRTPSNPGPPPPALAATAKSPAASPRALSPQQRAKPIKQTEQTHSKPPPVRRVSGSSWGVWVTKETLTLLQSQKWTKFVQGDRCQRPGSPQEAVRGKQISPLGNAQNSQASNFCKILKQFLDSICSNQKFPTVKSD
jgi:hypothetical protein